MTSPGGRAPQRLVKIHDKGGDPWCLTCGVNLALEGRTYTVLSHHRTDELCDIFSRVLGAELSEEYASVNVCNRCERQLRRLGRYNSIILARHEGQKLREQLEKNLAKHGQSVVESGDTEDFSPSSSPATAADAGVTSASRRRSLESAATTKKKFPSRRSSGSSAHSETSIDEGVEPGDSRGRGRGAGERKHSAPAGNLRNLSPFGEGEQRREARRRKWSNTSSTSEDSGPISHTSTEDRKVSADTRGVALSSLQHRSAAFRDAYLPSQKSDGSDQHKVSDDQGVDSPAATSQPSSKCSEGLSLGDSTCEDADMAASSEKKTLLERSESLEESNRRDKFKKRKFFSLGFLTSKFSGSKSQDEDKSPEGTTKLPAGEGEQESAAKPASDEKQERDENDKSPVYWSERVNPFDQDQKKTPGDENVDSSKSFNDGLSDKGIIDLDEPEAKKDSVPRMDSLQADEELMAKLDSTKFETSRAESISSDSSFMDASEYNLERGSSLSETEERINLKSQFKGAYYNIGSTEDLLQEFGSEADREKCKLVMTESVDRDDAENVSAASEGDKSTGRPEDIRSQVDKNITGKTGDQEQDNAPLIDEGDNEDKENKDEENMPFGFGKKSSKKASPPPRPPPPGEGTKNTDGTTAGTDDEVAQKGDSVLNGEAGGVVDKKADGDYEGHDLKDSTVEQEVKVNGIITDSEPSSKIETSTVDGKPVVHFAADSGKDDSQPTQGEDTPATEKSEKSRLINKNEVGSSAFKDQQPGFLCCVIL